MKKNYGRVFVRFDYGDFTIAITKIKLCYIILALDCVNFIAFKYIYK